MWDLLAVGIIIALAAAFVIRTICRSLKRGRAGGCMLCPCSGKGNKEGLPACMAVNLDSMPEIERQRLSGSFPECYKHCLKSGRDRG